MKVLVVTNMYPSEQEPWKGIFVKEQIEDLRALGIEIEIQHFTGKNGRASYLGAIRELRRRVRAGPYDLVHAHYGLTGAIAVCQRRLPSIVTFHGSDTLIPWQRAVSAAVARLVTPIFVSEQSRRKLRAKKGFLVPCGVDLDTFRPRDRVAAREELRWDETAVYVVFPSSPGNRVKRWDLFEATVETARAGLSDLRTIVIDGLAREQVALTLAAADATLMTSDREGSPMVVKESLSCCTPVVSVDVGDVREMIEGLPGCRICDRDPGSLSAALLEAVRSERAEVLRERANDYSRPSVAERVRAVYERVLSKSPKLEAPDRASD